MSDVQPGEPTAAEKPAAPAKAAHAEKPAEPAEPPFTTDGLQSCTARFSHKAWYLYLNNRQNTAFIRETPVQATLEARSTEGAETLEGLLAEAGVQNIIRKNVILSFKATFEQIQAIIKHPQTFLIDAAPAA